MLIIGICTMREKKFTHLDREPPNSRLSVVSLSLINDQLNVREEGSSRIYLDRAQMPRLR